MDASVHAGISILEGCGRAVAEVGRPRVNLAGRSVFDAVVDGRVAVVKVDADATRSAAEAEALRIAARHGVPVPELVEYIEGAPAVLVMAKVDGTPLTAFLSSAIWREAGFALRRIHSLPPGPLFGGVGEGAEGAGDAAPGPAGSAGSAEPFAAGGTAGPTGVAGSTGPFDEVGRAEPFAQDGRAGPSQGERMTTWTESEMSRSRENGLLSPAERRAVRGLLGPVWRTMSDSPLCLVHGDAQADHFLVGPDRRMAGVVDFGDAHLGDPVTDLAVLTLMHPGQLEAVLTGYRPARATRERINALIEPMRILRHVAVANWKSDHGLDPTPHLNALRARVSVEPRTIHL